MINKMYLETEKFRMKKKWFSFIEQITKPLLISL